MAMIAPNDARLRGILFSGFSAGQGEGRWVPAIEQRGVRIDRIEDLHHTRKKGEATVRGYDVALYMFERSTHGHSEILKRDCKLAGVKLVLIKTAISSWPSDFRDPTDLDANGQQQTVKDADLEPFLREYQARWQKGERPFQMLDAMKRYWSVGELRRADQLADYVKQLGDRAPEWFREWYATEVGSQRRLVAVPPPAPSEPVAVVPVIKEITKVIPPPKGLATIGEMLAAKEEKAAPAPVVTKTYHRGKTGPTSPIANEDVDAACKAFMEAWDAGVRHEALVERMAAFWTYAPLTNAAQALQNFRHRVEAGRCPPWFAEWWEKRGARKAPNKGSSQKMEETNAKVGRHIADANVDEACKRFREMYEAGVPLDEMRAKVADLWSGPVPEQNDDFVNVFRGFALGARGSKSFKRWWNGARKQIKRPTVKDVRLARGLPYNNGKGTPKTGLRTKGLKAMQTQMNGTPKKAAPDAMPSLEEVIQALDVLRRAGGFLEESTMFAKLGAYAAKR